MSGIVATGRPTAVWRVAAASLVALLLAASWMLLTLFAGKAGLGRALTEQSVGQAALGQTVTRTGITSQGTKIQILLATPEYFERTGQTRSAAEIQPEKYLVFIVTEENHDALKPAPMPTLLADGKRVAAPVKERLLSTSDHHRTRLVRFVGTAPDGQPYLPDGTRRVELAWPDLLPGHLPDHTQGNPLGWAWPLVLPAETAATGVSPLGFLILTAGLFAALSPCLVQLTLYYLSNLAGVSARPGGNRRRILLVAGMFTAGMSAAYTLGGVLAGYLGRAIQVSDVLGTYGRWIAIGAGLFILVMGLRTVMQSEAPPVCKLHLPGAGKLSRWQTGPVAPFLNGFLMSLGCLQCFGGALFASLLVYVGSLGSPGLGALMLFLFSLGIGLPFMAAALAWDRISGWLTSAGRAMQYLALGSGVLMMTFGILMIIDRFHWISGLLVRWMPFLQA